MKKGQYILKRKKKAGGGEGKRRNKQREIDM